MTEQGRCQRISPRDRAGLAAFGLENTVSRATGTERAVDSILNSENRTFAGSRTRKAMLLSPAMSEDMERNPLASLEFRGETVKGETAALITGGGTGIGLAIACSLAAAGAAVAVTGRRRAPLEAAADRIRDAGGTAIWITGDVASADDCQRMVEETAEQLGGLEILINNAGVAESGPLAEMTPERVDRLIDIDLKGPVHMTRSALPFLSAPRRSRESGHGGTGGSSVVINVSSSVTRHPIPGYSVYAAAKAGLDMLTRNWARELGESGIRVNAVCPGVVRTPIHESKMESTALAAFLTDIGGLTPLGRTGEVDDIASLVRFLASPAADWITGAVIPIDGGLSLT